jgi:hypothetical protein
MVSAIIWPIKELSQDFKTFFQIYSYGLGLNTVGTIAGLQFLKDLFDFFNTSTYSRPLLSTITKCRRTIGLDVGMVISIKLIYYKFARDFKKIWGTGIHSGH